MAHRTTPHTQSQQDVPPDQSDFEPISHLTFVQVTGEAAPLLQLHGQE
jgi:hypothetical protein